MMAGEFLSQAPQAERCLGSDASSHSICLIVIPLPLTSWPTDSQSTASIQPLPPLACSATGSKYLRTGHRESLSTRAIVRVECPFPDMILICVWIRTLVLSLASIGSSSSWPIYQRSSLRSEILGTHLILGGSPRCNWVGTFREIGRFVILTLTISRLELIIVNYVDRKGNF